MCHVSSFTLFTLTTSALLYLDYAFGLDFCDILQIISFSHYSVPAIRLRITAKIFQDFKRKLDLDNSNKLLYYHYLFRSCVFFVNTKLFGQKTDTLFCPNMIHYDMTYT